MIVRIRSTIPFKGVVAAFVIAVVCLQCSHTSPNESRQSKKDIPLTKHVLRKNVIIYNQEFAEQTSRCHRLPGERLKESIQCIDSAIHNKEPTLERLREVPRKKIKGFLHTYRSEKGWEHATHVAVVKEKIRTCKHDGHSRCGIWYEVVFAPYQCTPGPSEEAMNVETDWSPPEAPTGG